ncbi:MAG: gliding motility-associated C-terminal domain-containing protein [Sphingobacteriales bacterium]
MAISLLNKKSKLYTLPVLLWVCITININAQSVCKDSVTRIKYTSTFFTYGEPKPWDIINSNDSGTILSKVEALGGTNRILRIGNNGNITWSKLSRAFDTPYAFEGRVAKQFSNGNILSSGLASYLPGSTGLPVSFYLEMLDANGNFLWKKVYNGINSVMVNEGAGNSIILCGNSDYGGIKVMVLDKNGNPLWTKSFIHNPDSSRSSWPVGIYFLNNSIYVSAIVYHTINYSTQIDKSSILLMKLDYTGGSLQKIKTYSPVNISNCQDCNSISDRTQVQLLQNKLFVLAGELGHDFYKQPNRFILQIDTGFNLIKSSLQKSLLPLTNRQTVQTTISPFNGDIVYSHTNSYLKDLPPYILNIIPYAYYTIIDTSGDLKTQRKVQLNNIPVGYESNLQFSFTGTETHQFVFDLLHGNPNPDELHIITSNNNYLSGIGCTGEDTVVFTTQPCITETVPFNWYSIRNETATAIPVSAIFNDFPINKETICKQVSDCEFIKLKGNTKICLDNPEVVFTVSKNNNCLKKTNWLFDSSVIKITSQPDDTTINVKFIKPYTGWVYAAVAGCQAKDSIYIEAANPALPVQIGNDTILCANTFITLSAVNTYKTYKWQNGSANNSLIVNKPGKYWIDVIDSCGNFYSDTITISAANYKINLGPDVEKCVDDSITLQGPKGYTNYKWEPNYGITDTTQNIVIIYSDKTIPYTLTVEKAPNCFVKDTIIVKVKPCPDDIYFPNIFTPNNDKRNDTFKPFTQARFTDYELVIYNRWGQKIFVINEPSNGWDGTLKGNTQPGGVYTWRCIYRIKNKKRQELKGTVVLLK